MKPRERRSVGSGVSWEEKFGYSRAIRPANTLVRANLVGEDYLVEIEAEAVVAGEREEGE